MLRDYFVEESPSSRACCIKCGIKIKKGDLRVKAFLGNKFGHSEYVYYCAVCGQDKFKIQMVDLKQEIKNCKQDIFELERFIQKKKNEN